MVDVDDAIIARLESHGETFEILIDPRVVNLVRDGKEVDLSDHMVIEEIFRDAKKGTRPEDKKIEEVFGTIDPLSVARQIILKGEVQLTTQQRKEMQESKRLRVVNIIARNAINPQTGAPHPPSRIEAAMEEARVHIDPFKSAESQVEGVLKVLRPLMPIRFDKVRIAVRLSGDQYGRCYDFINKSGKVTKEEWHSSGSWIGVIELPAGLRDDFLGRLNELTKGEVETKILKGAI
ncbi:MAG TPA: ribosome assembly factor SBDS [Methanomassiliicoccaceae archaeon]|jgi:ribosome maturation protein SDO1|nr:ribosome assembly factor SBDS [Euryarchaeota archaeon]HOB38380.1 ribosome assembly factor SBDS [Methanomassiliicoccaceae archaeon]HOQ25482.1 ribosome assembly factor SBDS [Methanomassiliicoccaceae archaeon]HPT73616.1 ribosome assembly factor SBDS [Methanomassiliicoccaceae archaeon]HQA20409.1 ribosome assembly factor SBDS [Methanomassiliicoccaceae archaeon]